MAGAPELLLAPLPISCGALQLRLLFALHLCQRKARTRHAIISTFSHVRETGTASNIDTKGFSAKRTAKRQTNPTTFISARLPIPRSASRYFKLGQFSASGTDGLSVRAVQIRRRADDHFGSKAAITRPGVHSIRLAISRHGCRNQ